jgi:uncharacterized protein
MKTERRMTPAASIKVETREDGSRMIAGYAAVFHRADDPGTQYQLSSDLVERIAPTAFARAITDKHDARALFNHDPNMLLGRAGAGTLRLTTDGTGLRYEIDLPDTQVGRDVAASVQRGDLTGSSFAFQVVKQSFQRGDKMHTRTIEDVNLLDVGPVTYPAYQSTTTGLRSDECDDALEAFGKWKQEADAEAVQVRMRVLSLDII